MAHQHQGNAGCKRRRAPYDSPASPARVPLGRDLVAYNIHVHNHGRLRHYLIGKFYAYPEFKYQFEKEYAHGYEVPGEWQSALGAGGNAGGIIGRF